MRSVCFWRTGKTANREGIVSFTLSPIMAVRTSVYSFRSIPTQPLRLCQRLFPPGRPHLRNLRSGRSVRKMRFLVGSSKRLFQAYRTIVSAG